MVPVVSRARPVVAMTTSKVAMRATLHRFGVRAGFCSSSLSLSDELVRGAYRVLENIVVYGEAPEKDNREDGCVFAGHMSGLLHTKVRVMPIRLLCQRPTRTPGLVKMPKPVVHCAVNQMPSTSCVTSYLWSNRCAGHDDRLQISYMQYIGNTKCTLHGPVLMPE